MDDPGAPDRRINIHFSPEHMGGAYANFANVSHSDYEFTITFARVDHEVEEEEVPGVVVSRINLSPRFMRELIDAMQDNYSKWQTREGIKNLPEFGGRGETAGGGGGVGVVAGLPETLKRLRSTPGRERHRGADPLGGRGMAGEQGLQPPRWVDVGEVLQRDAALERDERLWRPRQLERVSVRAALDRAREPATDHPDGGGDEARREREPRQRLGSARLSR